MDKGGGQGVRLGNTRAEGEGEGPKDQRVCMLGNERAKGSKGPRVYTPGNGVAKGPKGAYAGQRGKWANDA